MSSVREIESELLQELALERPDFVGATLDPSPNFGPRRDGKVPAFLILHYTGLATAEEAVQVLKSPDMEVSAHYLVHEDGRIVQMVSEKARAWHAGKSFWKGETDINSASIGIEIVNPGNLENYPPFKDAQVDALIRLCSDICERYAIKPENVLAHSDIAPSRKTDPGHNFPWKRLHDAGVGHYIEPTPAVDDTVPVCRQFPCFCPDPAAARRLPDLDDRDNERKRPAGRGVAIHAGTLWL